MRPVIVFIVALCVFAGGLVTVGASVQQRDVAVRGYEDPLTTTDLPYRVPRLGVNADLMQYPAAALPAQLDRMQDAGIVWVRQIFDWGILHPAPGAYNWEAADRVIDAFKERDDLHLIAVLVNSPAWSRTEGTSTAPPDDPADFATFADAFAGRYGAIIDHYQVWDEPNLSGAWGGGQPNPGAYAALLAAGHTALHAADGTATVLAAGLAPTTENTQLNMRDDLFLDALYRLGAAAYFDAAAGKPYGFSLPPDDRTVDPDVLNFSRLILLREVMRRHNDGNTPLWGSAFGWNTLPTDWPGAPSIWGGVSADGLIAHTLAAFDRAEHEWAWLGGLLIQHWQPAAPFDDPIQGFALIDPTGQSTGLYTALVDRHVARDQAAGIGLHHPISPYAGYTGVWTLGELGADIGWLQDSRLTFRFTGSAVGLLLREDNYVAFLYPRVNGERPHRLPVDSLGNAYITLTSGTRTAQTERIAIADRLPTYQPHTLTVTADRGWDRWALAGYIVSAGDLAAPYNAQITWAAIMAALGLIAVVVNARAIDWTPLSAVGRAIWCKLNIAGQIGAAVLASLALMIGMLLTFNDALPTLFRRDPPALGLAILTGGLLYLAPHTLLVIAAGIALFIIIYQRIALGLMLTVLFAPFFFFPIDLFIFAFPMAELVLLITAAAWAMRGLVAWAHLHRAHTPITFTIRLHPLDWGMIAFVGLGIVSLVWAADRDLAITDLRTLIIEPAIFYLIYRTSRPSHADLLRLIDALLIAGGIVCVIGLGLYLQGDAIITAEGGARRLASVYGSPNNVALWLGRCIPFALAFMLAPVDGRRRAAAGGLLVLMTITLLLTQSAGGLFIGVPAAIIAVIVLTWGRRSVLPLIGLGAIGAAGLAIALQSDRFARLLTLTEGTNFFRLRVWQSALNVIRDHPLTGLGMDQFLYAFRGRYLLPDAWQEPDLSHPHNVILDAWVRLGIGGVVIFIALQVAFWQSIWCGWRAATSPLMQALAIGVIGAMINLLAHGLIDNGIFVLDLAYVFVLLLAAAYHLDRNRTDELLTQTGK